MPLDGPFDANSATSAAADEGVAQSSGAGSAGKARRSRAAKPAAAESLFEPGVARGRVFKRPLLDAGWLFLVPGLVLIAMTVLLPALEDLEKARFYQQRLALLEQHRLMRLQNYTDYLKLIQQGDESTILSLAAVQLNKAPEGKALLLPAGELASRSADVFARLEPPPMVLPEWRKNRSTMENLAHDSESRVWVMLVGATLVLLGLLIGSGKLRS
jgi:ABC-type sugar transport system permease subunit